MTLRERLAEALRRRRATDKDAAESEEPKRPEPFDHEYYRDDRVPAAGAVTIRVGGRRFWDS